MRRGAEAGPSLPELILHREVRVVLRRDDRNWDIIWIGATDEHGFSFLGSINSRVISAEDLRREIEALISKEEPNTHFTYIFQIIPTA